MYYQKYFEGSVTADSGYTVQYCPVPGTKQASSQVAGNSGGGVLGKLTVVGNAIASTLADCGMDARYVPATGYLYFDYANSDIGMFLTSGGTTTTARNQFTIYDGYNSGSYIAQMESRSITDMFNATGLVAADYKFCVTIRGDITSMFTIYVGKYSTPTSITNIVGTFYFGVDKRNDNALFGSYQGAPTTYIIWRKVSDLTSIIDTTSSSTMRRTPATKLTMIDQNIVLIEQYMTNAGFIAMDDVYIDPGFGTSGEFYEIDGETYFCYTPYFIKCVTDVEPTSED